MVRGHQACSSGSPQARCNSVANPLPVCAGWRAKQDDEARNQLSRHCETWQKHKGRGLPKGHAQKGRGSQAKTCEKCRQRRIRCKHMRATGRGTGEASGRKALTLTDMFRSTKQPLMLPQSHFEARHHKRSVDGGGAVARSSHVDGACGKDLQASASLKLLLIAAAGAVGWSNDREKFVPFEACHANTPNARCPPLRKSQPCAILLRKCTQALTFENECQCSCVDAIGGSGGGLGDGGGCRSRPADSGAMSTTSSAYVQGKKAVVSRKWGIEISLKSQESPHVKMEGVRDCEGVW